MGTRPARWRSSAKSAAATLIRYATWGTDWRKWKVRLLLSSRTSTNSPFETAMRGLGTVTSISLVASSFGKSTQGNQWRESSSWPWLQTWSGFPGYPPSRAAAGRERPGGGGGGGGRGGWSSA